MPSSSPPASDPLPSGLRDGRYAVVRRLGEGGQATTFEAVDKRQGKPVAIKRFRVRGAKSWKEVELAEREARVLASLSHPLLPRYVEHFEEGGELYLVTELVGGESLASLRRRGERLDERDVVRLLRDVSEALDYLHGRAPPVVHRDIKPSNVLRRDDGRFVLIDFGAVRDRMRPEGGSTVVGTFGYMAPEQFQGRAMPASDVYAVAATAVALLTGREPEELPHKGLAVDVRTALAGRASPALTDALARMLEPDPDVRPAAIAPLLARLSGDHGQPKVARARSGWGARVTREAERAVKEAERRARRDERRARREARHAGRDAARAIERWQGRRRPGRPAPFPVSLAMILGLTLAQLALVVALRLVVPTVLTFLSVFFGAGLRRAARQVSEAGQRAFDSVGRAKRVVTRGEAEEEADEVRVRFVDEAETPRVRVEGEDANEDEDEDDETDEAEPPPPVQRR